MGSPGRDFAGVRRIRSVDGEELQEAHAGAIEASVLTHVLGDLAQLARTAERDGRRLYCWVCV
jgi:hypothetical protein